VRHSAVLLQELLNFLLLFVPIYASEFASKLYMLVYKRAFAYHIRGLCSRSHAVGVWPTTCDPPSSDRHDRLPSPGAILGANMDSLVTSRPLYG
jgi:hypothetical protein